MKLLKMLIVVFIISIINNSIASDIKSKNIKNKQLQNIVTLSQNSHGKFAGTFNNAPLKQILQKIAKYTNLNFFIYPKVKKNYNLKFTNWSEKELIDAIVKDLNSYRVFTKGNEKITKSLVLLDSTDKHSGFKNIETSLRQINFNFNERFSNINNTKALQKKILDIPEIISLLNISKEQKQHDLFYQRIVNPQNPSSAYTFKVRYNKQHKMMIPFEKNGKSNSKEAEGFINFSTVANTIIKKQDLIEAFREGKDVYIRFKDKSLKDTFMLINGDVDSMEIVQKIGTQGLPNMQTRLIGNKDKFTVLTQINHSKGLITLADRVIAQ